MTVATRARPGWSRALRAAVGPAVRAAVLPFAVSRVIVLVALALARFLVDKVQIGSLAAREAAHAGLLGWDAAWYQRIEAHGYSHLPRSGLRFFPLFPVVARAFGAIPGLDSGGALLVVANLGALSALALLYHLVLYELGDEAQARRAVWLLALAPPAFVLVMGYSESLLVSLSIAAFLGLRQRHYGLAIGASFLAGLCRPVGVLLAVPALVELVRNWRSVPDRERLLGAGSVLAAPVGAAAYLTWVRVVFGSFSYPISEQLTRNHRGGFADPIATLVSDARNLVHGTHLGTAEHAPWALLLLGLAVVAFLKLPAAYGWYAAATLAVALSAPNLDSLERYGLGCFPFVVAAAVMTRSQGSRWMVIALSGSLLTVYALLAFLGAYVP